MSNKLLGYIKEKELTHDDVIAMIDEHLQREITEEREPDGEEEVVDDETGNSTVNDEVAENDEIEQFSESQIDKKMEELDDYIVEKKKEIDKYVRRIKRKEPPSGDISDKALTNNQKIKVNWFEVDV